MFNKELLNIPNFFLVGFSAVLTMIVVHLVITHISIKGNN